MSVLLRGFVMVECALKVSEKGRKEFRSSEKQYHPPFGLSHVSEVGMPFSPSGTGPTGPASLRNCHQTREGVAVVWCVFTHSVDQRGSTPHSADSGHQVLRKSVERRACEDLPDALFDLRIKSLELHIVFVERGLASLETLCVISPPYAACAGPGLGSDLPNLGENPKCEGRLGRSWSPDGAALVEQPTSCCHDFCGPFILRHVMVVHIRNVFFFLRRKN